VAHITVLLTRDFLLQLNYMETNIVAVGEWLLQDETEHRHRKQSLKKGMVMHH
jgi:hypothetical protein